VIRSSPQFGFTLLAYEYLHKVCFLSQLNGLYIDSPVSQYLPVRIYLLMISSLVYSLFAMQYPWQDKPRQVETALTTSRQDDMSKIRARNALKILLDVHGDFGERAASALPLAFGNRGVVDRSL
jgi:solute carrier family 25 aspartate/glutamate transporter 12/13